MATRPLAPQPFAPNILTSSAPLPSKCRKASYACLACKERKSRCDQGSPCKVCQIHHSNCVYDEAADQRRKIARQKLIDEFSRQRHLLTSIVAVMRSTEPAHLVHLLEIVRSNTPLKEVSSYLERELYASAALQTLLQQVNIGEGSVSTPSRSPEVPQEQFAPIPVLQGMRSPVGLPRNALVTLESPPRMRHEI